MNNPWPQITANDVSWITTTDMIEVDRVMIEDLHIELIQMMENAGRNLAAAVIGLFRPRSAVIYTGSGGNGGGGLVAARHLANRGVDVTVVATRPADELAGVPRHQMDILELMGIPIATEPVPADVAVDALIGYSLSGAPRGKTAELINYLNEIEAPIVALDVPSGLDSTTGETPGVAIKAAATLTLAMPKIGLQNHAKVGRLLLGDISVPPSVYVDMGLPERSLFDDSPIVEII